MRHGLLDSCQSLGKELADHGLVSYELRRVATPLRQLLVAELVEFW